MYTYKADALVSSLPATRRMVTASTPSLSATSRPASTIAARLRAGRADRPRRLTGLGEEYFISLLTHSDITTAKSHNPRFTPKQVQMLRLAFLALFY